MAAEDAGWDELHSLMDRLTAGEAERPGYYAEGWSAKDLLGHIGSWLAEAGVLLERISVGTYRRDEIDVEAMNRRFFEAFRDVPFQTIRAQASAARTRMLQAWRTLPDPTDPEAV